MDLFFRFPFNISTPIGFFFAITLSSVNSAIYLALFSLMVSLDIGYSRYAYAAFDAFEYFTRGIERIPKIQYPKTLRFSIISIMKLHLTTFDLLNKIQRIKSGPYFQQLCTYTFFIAHFLNSPVSVKCAYAYPCESILIYFSGYR